MRILSTTLVLASLVSTGVAAIPPATTGSAGSSSVQKSQAEPLENGIRLTLREAIARAVQLSPSLAAGTYALSAAEARVAQAGLYPNPEFQLEAENFGGGEELSGFNTAETTAVFSQPILLGGKRGHRRSVAESDKTLASRSLEAVRLDLISETTSAFYRVLAAQERESLAVELLDLAERSSSTVRVRVEAGKVSPVEGTRAGIEVSHARVRLERATRELQAARFRLAATWGSTEVDFHRVVGDMPRPEAPPSLQELRTILMETPEINRLRDLIHRQEAVLELERSIRTPDLTISAGPRRFEETGESAWVAGLALPLPLFDRNQGARKSAELELERARNHAEAIRISLETELATTTELLNAAALEAMTMEREVVPAASMVFAATETGYVEGKFSFIHVLDAQRVLFEARSTLLKSVEEFAIARTALERLVGRSLGDQGPAQGEIQ